NSRRTIYRTQPVYDPSRQQRQSSVDSQGGPVMLELMEAERLDGPWDLIQVMVKERGHFGGHEVRRLWVMKSPVWDCD
ncbi:uncharacterized, partial [Tachysurus ichikawai]